MEGWDNNPQVRCSIHLNRVPGSGSAVSPFAISGYGKSLTHCLMAKDPIARARNLVSLMMPPLPFWHKPWQLCLQRFPMGPKHECNHGYCSVVALSIICLSRVEGPVCRHFHFLELAVLSSVPPFHHAINSCVPYMFKAFPIHSQCLLCVPKGFTIHTSCVYTFLGLSYSNIVYYSHAVLALHPVCGDSPTACCH